MPVQWVAEHVQPRFVMKAGEVAVPLMNTAGCWHPCPSCAVGLLGGILRVDIGFTLDLSLLDEISNLYCCFAESPLG